MYSNCLILSMKCDVRFVWRSTHFLFKQQKISKPKKNLNKPKPMLLNAHVFSLEKYQMCK